MKIEFSGLGPLSMPKPLALEVISGLYLPSESGGAGVPLISRRASSDGSRGAISTRISRGHSSGMEIHTEPLGDGEKQFLVNRGGTEWGVHKREARNFEMLERGQSWQRYGSFDFVRGSLCTVFRALSSGRVSSVFCPLLARVFL